MKRKYVNIARDESEYFAFDLGASENKKFAVDYLCSQPQEYSGDLPFLKFKSVTLICIQYHDKHPLKPRNR